ncbi:putative wall-associated receptor kinase-like 16 [Abrus precatorius]|uniref:Wall-associated receptor kinase-like 16 n=1 Tax=Abrus precatorius TaxID=3816 RepID=A0A8B8MHV3_ABRPR|nr:putative wall-associated receptor kinase-like 16 [Abrus precatorius]
MQMQLTLLLVTALATVGAAPPDLALPGCPSKCGNVSIPYPFGIGNSKTGRRCFLEAKMNFTCNQNDLVYGNVPIVNITLKGKMEMLTYISQVRKTRSDEKVTESTWSTVSLPDYPISSDDNKFISVGCDTYGYLRNFHEGEISSTGCLSICNSTKDVPADGNCTGVGCCQVDIPRGMKNISVRAYTFDNFSDTWEFNNCSLSFVVKKENYSFSVDHLKSVPFEMAPLIVDWNVGHDTCENAKLKDDYACKKNSHCEDSATRSGYLCQCNKGFQGNPYLNGCQDIEECKTDDQHNCVSKDNCREKQGSFECFCPEGQIGNGTRESGGCRQKQRDDKFTKVATGVGAGLMALLFGSSWLYLIYQKRKLIRLKERFFRQNGGIILKQQLSVIEDSSQSTMIFTSEQLKKATNNYDESMIIGSGGYGTVFKGFLSDHRIVAVKKSKVGDQSQIEQFINEVVVLSQINHRNVVKLLGCCLETEVPLLVYEFVNNGTLFDYLHKGKETTNVSWKTRLRIAAEAAGALSYLHSAASIPIIHRDVKTANILLDDTYTAKVSDFGASRLVPLDHTEIATIVQGTFGYLDPEYMQTSQLTEKSDVYSFGVVLVELLTGEKPFSFDKTEEKRSLAVHFLSCLKEDRLLEVIQVDILNIENKEQVMEVAILASRCLRLRGDERPGMKEVARELDRIKLVEEHPWTNTNQEHEEIQYLLHEAHSIREHGDSSDQQNTGYDSLRDHVLIAMDDGR